eukprot:SAG22_NODE_5065_length_1095_cov_0.824297_1_plen_150_part_00
MRFRSARAKFRATMEKSFATLDMEGNGLKYLDLFAFHGINSVRKLDWVLKPGGCMGIIEEYRAKGLVSVWHACDRARSAPSQRLAGCAALRWLAALAALAVLAGCAALHCTALHCTALLLASSSWPPPPGLFLLLLLCCIRLHCARATS